MAFLWSGSSRTLGSRDASLLLLFYNNFNVLGSGVSCCCNHRACLEVVTHLFLHPFRHQDIWSWRFLLLEPLRTLGSRDASFLQSFHFSIPNNRDYNNSQDNNSTPPRQIRQLDDIEFEPNQNTSRSLSQNQNDFNDASARC